MQIFVISNINMPQKIVESLIIHFFNHSSKFSLQPWELNEFTWDEQERFINATINNERLKKYPMSSEFCRLFLKKLVDALEPIQEVHDDMFTFLCSSMKDSNKDFYYKHYLVNNRIDNIITIKETKNMVVNGTTGMRTWQAALMLADFALSNRSIFEGKHVLELGSGVGFTGIAIAKYCNINSILLTDCHDEVLNTLRENININFSQEADNCNIICSKENPRIIDVKMLDWNSIEDIPDDRMPEVIIGADIIYDPSIIKSLCNVILEFSNKNRSLDVYIANIIRNENTYKLFLQTLDKMGFKWHDISQDKCSSIEWDNTINKCLLKIKYSR